MMETGRVELEQLKRLGTLRNPSPQRPARFDWDHARRLRDLGWTIPQLAERFHVSESGIRRVLTPERLADSRARHVVDARRTNRSRGKRCECGAAITNKATRCRPCSDQESRSSVRELELRCTLCRKWKPDAEYGEAGSTPRVRDRLEHRRFRRYACRQCETEKRRERRRRGGR